MNLILDMVSKAGGSFDFLNTFPSKAGISLSSPNGLSLKSAGSLSFFGGLSSKSFGSLSFFGDLREKIADWDFWDKCYKCFVREDRYKLLLDGIGVTIKVSLFAIALGILIGLIIAVCNLSKSRVLKAVGKIYTDIIRGTPSVTQLMIIYFVIFASVHWEKWIIASIAFGINSGAYVAEIIRAGIMSIDKGQSEAGRSLGLNEFQTMTKIILPQAVKNIFPALCNEFIVLIKETAIVGYVGLMDIQKAGDFIKSSTYEAFTPLIATAIIYYIIIKILNIGLARIEAALRKSDLR